jgi:hypothetical protein
LAGLAVLVIVSSLPQGAPASIPADGRALSADEVAIAITVDSRAVAAALRPGDQVSVVAVSDEGFSSIIAETARVLEGSSSGGFGPADSAVTVAVDEASALRLAGASARGTLTVIIRPPAR